jgi:type IV secretion system protein VirD4
MHARNPIKPLILSGLLFYGADYLSFLSRNPDWLILYYFVLLFAILAGIQAVILILFFVIPQALRYIKAWRIVNKVGSAGWASKREMKKQKMHKKRGLLVGIAHNFAAFCNIESSMLVLAPAGAGKTRDFVIPNLLYNKTNMIVTDLKGTLACITAKARAKFFKQNIIILNPAGLYADILGNSARYNPMTLLMEHWQDETKHKYLFSDARALIRQIAPSPKFLTDNEYFRAGSAKFMLFAFVRLVTTKDNPTFTDALNLLSDLQALEAELYEAACEDILNGDLARLAKDIITKLEDGDPKQRESFREGAIQHLEEYSSSGLLSDNTSQSDFRFRDMRDKKMTVYILADPAVQTVFEKWVGIIAWCAITELTRTPTGQEVTLMLDEATNFKVNGLPDLLTKLREFKLRLILIMQELQEWANTYDMKSTETLLSQTQAKLFLVATNQTAKLISQMLGDMPQKQLSYNLGRSFFDDLTRTLNEGGRPLMTPDEVRRAEHAILFYKHLKPAKVETVGYHRISPLKHRAGINPLFGKRYRKWWSRLKL